MIVDYYKKIIFSLLTATVVLFSASAQPNEPQTTNQILFPQGVTVNVGQVGWMGGSSLDDVGGPWRAGIRRDFDVRDYKPVVEVGKALGIRFMTLFILGELDRLNILAEYPTSNPAGENWDNSKYTSPVQLEIMDYVKNNAANMEFGITGVLHEYWENGVKSRAEWYNVEEQKPRDEKIIRNNIELIKRIMAQYGITPENGHSFPESFISYGFYYKPGEGYSLGRVLSENGVKYANTHFTTMKGLDHPPYYDGGFDNGVLLLDRHTHGNLWYEYAKPPVALPESIRTVVVESHWANWLAYDDHLQPELNIKWIEYLRSIQADPDHYLTKNTEQLYSQWLYKKYTKVEESGRGKVTIDNRSMPEDPYIYNLLGNMVLAVKLGEGQHISHAALDGKQIASFYEAEGYGYMYLPPLEQKSYNFEYTVGKDLMNRVVNNKGTYNVYSLADNGSSIEIDIKMYGEQTVEVRSPKPASVRSTNQNLLIKSFSYDDKNSVTSVIVNGRNIQGERGIVVLTY